MGSVLRVAAIFAACACGAAIGIAAEPKEQPKSKVELRWVESFRVEGLTADRGVGDPDSPVYPHKTPALVLTRKDVAEARLNQHEWMMNDVVVPHYSVTLILTKEARDRLAASCPGKSARVTVAVDGRYWGWHHYTTDNDAKVSELCKAKNFNPYIGLMSSKAEAEHVVDAFK
jgi:hypothetical protein